MQETGHEVRLAYMILAHRLPGQLVRLVERLRSPRASFFVHVDRKTPKEAFAEAFDVLGGRPDVHFARRFRLHWGSYGHVQATLTRLAEATARGGAFDHYVLLTGQDYPIKPREVIESHFARHPATSFMEWFRLPRDDWPHEGGLERVSYRYYRVPFRSGREPERRFVRVPSPRLRFVPRQRLPAGYAPHHGSAYWSLSRSAAEYAHDFARDHRWYRRYMRRALLPEEFFFQTAIMNSPHAQGVVNNDLHYVDWSEGGFHPAVLEPRHIPDLAASDALFARKFDGLRSPETLEMVDRELLGITSAWQTP